jgi:hypothetical protein
MAVDLLLVTCSSWLDGEPGSAVLDAALTEQGVTSRWVRWDDPEVDWASSLVAVRSTWDYQDRVEEFIGWARSVPRLLNGADVFAWNTDKYYLVELDGSGLPVVPTISVDTRADLPAAVATFGQAVVKPRVGAGGVGVVVVDGPEAAVPGDGPWAVQPLVASVRTEGETSVFVLGGQPVSMVRKLPAGDEIRVNEHYGGTTVAVVPAAEATDLARRAVEVAEAVLATRLDYARVDLMRLEDGILAVSELELTEPGLYLEELPANGTAFAALVSRLLAG